MKQLLGILFVLVFSTHCGHGEGQGRPAPVIRLNCSVENCPVGAIIKTIFVKESCSLTQLNDENYYFYSEDIFKNEDCTSENCSKSISSWKKKNGGSVSEFPERTYTACAFVDTDGNGTFENSNGDYSGTVSGITLKKDVDTHDLEVSSML